MEGSTPSIRYSQVFGLTGKIERVEDNHAIGWAVDLDYPNTAVRVDIRLKDKIVGSGLANAERADLADAGFGDGRHGFRIPLQIPGTTEQKIEIELYDSVSHYPIADIPFSLYGIEACNSDKQSADTGAVNDQPARKAGVHKHLFKDVIAPIFRPIVKLSEHHAFMGNERLPAGVVAKLARIDNMTVTSLGMSSEWPKIRLPAFDADKQNGTNVSIIIAVHDQYQLTHQCLVSLVLSCDIANIEVILVDDASTDVTATIESRVENIRVLRNDMRRGVLHSFKSAAEVARGDYLVFLNNDTEVENRWIDNLLEVFNRFRNVGAAGAKLISPNGQLQAAGGLQLVAGQAVYEGRGKQRDDPDYNYVREVHFLSGAALMVSRVAWDVVGGYDEKFAPARLEDVDLAFKLKEAGFRSLYCPHAVVVHFGSNSKSSDVSASVGQRLANGERFTSVWAHRLEEFHDRGVGVSSAKKAGGGLQVLMVCHELPRQGVQNDHHTVLQDIKLMLGFGCHVTCLPETLQHPGASVIELQKLGVNCVHSPFCHSMESFVEERATQFDAVYVYGYRLAERVTPIVRQISTSRIILNCSGLYFLKEIRASGGDDESDFSRIDTIRKRELAMVKKADAVLSHSDVEIEILASHLLAREKLFHSPPVVRGKGEVRSWKDRCDLAFVGDFSLESDRLAMSWFVGAVMPQLLASRPALKLHVWGRSTMQCEPWSQQQGVVLHGEVKSFDDVFNTIKIYIAPLQIRAEFNDVVLTSVDYGVPAVLSTIAVEKTGLVNGYSTLQATTVDQWVAQIERLLDDTQLWSSVSGILKGLRSGGRVMQELNSPMQQAFDYVQLDTRKTSQYVDLP